MNRPEKSLASGFICCSVLRRATFSPSGPAREESDVVAVVVGDHAVAAAPHGEGHRGKEAAAEELIRKT